jgi:hypothetical protein
MKHTKKAYCLEAGKEITISGRPIGPSLVDEIMCSKDFMRVSNVIAGNRKQIDRENILRMDYPVFYEVACGSGGVNSIRVRKNGDVYLQFTCGHGRNNYADCVKIGKIECSSTTGYHFYGQIFSR